MQLYIFFTLIHFLTYPFLYRLSPSLKPSRKTDPNEVTCKKKKTTKKQKKKHKKKKKNHKNQSPKKLKVQSSKGQ